MKNNFGSIFLKLCFFWGPGTQNFDFFLILSNSWSPQKAKMYFGHLKWLFSESKESEISKMGSFVQFGQSRDDLCSFLNFRHGRDITRHGRDITRHGRDTYF